MKTANVKTKKPTALAKVAGVDKATIDNLVEVFKSLSDPSRLQILLILAKHGEMHVNAICELLGQSQPAVSHHLTQLKHAELVDFDRTGKFNIYKLESTRLRELIEAFFPHASTAQQKVVYGDLEVFFKAK